MKFQMSLVAVLGVNKVQKCYIKINSLKLQLTSIRWPPHIHWIKKIIKIKKSDLKQNIGFFIFWKKLWFLSALCIPLHAYTRMCFEKIYYVIMLF